MNHKAQKIDTNFNIFITPETSRGEGQTGREGNACLPSTKPIACRNKNVPPEIWMEVAERLSPKDFLSFTGACRRFYPMRKNLQILQSVAANSQLVPPACVQMGKAAHRLPREPEVTLRAESQLVARLGRGPIVVDTSSTSPSFQLAPSKLHVALFDASTQRCTVVPLSSGVWPTLTVSVEKEHWAFFGPEAFEFIAQESHAGPLWLYDLSDPSHARKHIAPAIAQGSMHALPVPQRSAYWVMYRGANEMKLFEPNMLGTFAQKRCIPVDANLALRSCSWTGDLITWTNWNKNAVELVKLDNSGRWKSLLEVELSGCGCEDIEISHTGAVALARHCSENQLVGFADEESDGVVTHHRLTSVSSTWEAPDGQSVIVPSDRSFSSFDLPRLAKNASLDALELPGWMQTHRAWAQSATLVQAEVLDDPFSEGSHLVIADANRHGAICCTGEKVCFTEPTSIDGVDILKDEVAEITNVAFDSQRRIVLYNMILDDGVELQHVSNAQWVGISQPVAAPSVEEDVWKQALPEG